MILRSPIYNNLFKKNHSDHFFLTNNLNVKLSFSARSLFHQRPFCDKTFRLSLVFIFPCCLQLPCAGVTADPLMGLPSRHEENIVHGLPSVMPSSENSFPITFGEPAHAPMLVQGLSAGASDLLYRRSLLVQVSRTPRMASQVKTNHSPVMVNEMKIKM